MTRVDEASLFIPTSPVRVYKALVKGDAVAQWLPPRGMSGVVERFDAKRGGECRIVLTYDDPSTAEAKSGESTDVVNGRFVEVDPGVRVVLDVDFESADAAFAGTMRMTWQTAAQGAGTLVSFRAEHVPPGIDAEQHVAGLTQSLENLAAYVS